MSRRERVKPVIANHSKGSHLAEQVQLAFDFWSRLCGLMFQPHLPDGQGLLLAPCRSVHTLYMRFPIDVVFLDRQLRVVGLEQNLVPWHFSPTYHRAWSALELPVGAIAASQTEIGDLLVCRASR